MGDFDFIEQMVTPSVTERLGKIYQKDAMYQKKLKEEDLKYKRLIEELTDKQADWLEEYMEAANATMARKEILTYVQGMKDLLALLKALS